MKKKVIRPFFIRLPDKEREAMTNHTESSTIVPLIGILGGEQYIRLTLFPVKHNVGIWDKTLLSTANMYAEEDCLKKGKYDAVLFKDTIIAFKSDFLKEDGSEFEDDEVIQFYMEGVMTAMTLPGYRSIGADFGIKTGELYRWISGYKDSDTYDFFRDTKFHHKEIYLNKPLIDFLRDTENLFSRKACIVKLTDELFFGGVDYTENLSLKNALTAARFQNEDEALLFLDKNGVYFRMCGYEIIPIPFTTYSPYKSHKPI